MEVVGSNPTRRTHVKTHTAIYSFRINLAHLVEQLSVKQCVVGSTPTIILYASCIWPYRLRVRTGALQAPDPGSNPGRVTITAREDGFRKLNYHRHLHQVASLL